MNAIIQEALDALLAQDYPNIRILVSDNASTDGTADICRAAAAADDRVTYRRETTNVGATRNFNQVFERSEGPYFLWAGDDDRWDPSFVRRCVEALEADAGAVMATTGLRFIDESGRILERDYAGFDNPDLSSTSSQERAAEILRRAGWYQCYGVGRREAFAQTRLFRDVFGPDVGFTLEMALQGPILKVPEVLFWYRQYTTRTHEGRVQRQGHIADESRVLSAKHTYLQESLTDAVYASALPRRTKAVIAADVFRAAYIEDTPLSRHTRREVRARMRSAVTDLDFGAFVKFASLGGYFKARRLARRSRRRVRRLVVGRHR